MADNCTDSTNENYQLFWFDYFVSIGYIDNSALVNLYAPYGKCTRSSLWITYLINIVHFFLLSSGVLYLISTHRDQSGLKWAFVTWISSFMFLLAAIILFIFLNFYITLFSILIIGFQLVALIILTVSIFTVVKVIFVTEYRYQRLLFVFIIILLLLQLGCFVGQVLITLHCLFNLKFFVTILDYSMNDLRGFESNNHVFSAGYWSAIIAAIGTIISTLLMDHIFMWYLNRQESPRVGPVPMSPQSDIRETATSPVDPTILEYFERQPKAPLFYVYSNTDQTRHFHIHPRLDGEASNAVQLLNLPGKRRKQRRLSSSDA